MVIREETVAEVRQLIDARFEWLIIRAGGKTFPVNKTEIEIACDDDKTLFGFLDDKGFHSWRLNGFTSNDGGIELDLAGAFGKKRETVRLVPRASAGELTREIEAARLARANEIAEILRDSRPGIKLTRIEPAKENGRIAQIFFKDEAGQLNAAMTDITGTTTTERLLSTALLWQDKLSQRKKNRINNVCIIAKSKHAKSLQKLLALLKPVVRETIKIAGISENAGAAKLTGLSSRSMGTLWREKTKKLAIPENPRPSETARRITELSPEKIDIIYSKQGETLRFMGLPFARIRSMLGSEKAWFGVNKTRHILNADTWNGLIELISDLENHRRFDSPNKHHEYFRTAPEAWLESILRRNIKLLDANLILSPIYNQFRASNDKIDLLALRRDGRLVIIELKTSPDREMIFQAAEYWRKIELQRRQGKLEEANLFGGLEILDKPGLVYLAAPAWSFHVDFDLFARTLSSEIEMWRFELHEKWRGDLKVVARRNYRDHDSGQTNL